VPVIYKSSGGRRHDKSHLHQNRAYCLRIRRECTLNRCHLLPYKRRYGPQRRGGAVGRAGHTYGPGAGTTNTTTNWLRLVATLIWPQLSLVNDALAPNPRVIGPLLVEIYCHVRLPRATLYRARTTHTTTIWLRPLATLIWPQRPMVDGAFPPNAKAIGAILVVV
jgi:hypothetical protein